MSRTTPYDFLTFDDKSIVISSIVSWQSSTNHADKPTLYITTVGGNIHAVDDPDGERAAHLVDTFTLYCQTEAAIDPKKLADEPYDALISTITERPPFSSASVKEQAKAFVKEFAKPWKETPEEELGKLQAEIQALRTMAEERGKKIADLEARIVEWAEGDRERVRTLRDKQRDITQLEADIARMRETNVKLEEQVEAWDAHDAERARTEARLQTRLACYSTFEQQVNAERRRQISDEGFTAIRDDSYRSGELIRAAICFALFAFSGSHDGRGKALLPLDESGMVKSLWPWSWSFWKTPSRQRALVKATALLVAEGDRQTRAKG